MEQLLAAGAPLARQQAEQQGRGHGRGTEAFGLGVAAAVGPSEPVAS
jgi:hypothetical protein